MLILLTITVAIKNIQYYTNFGKTPRNAFISQQESLFQKKYLRKFGKVKVGRKSVLIVDL